MAADHSVARWSLENRLDEENAPLADKLRRVIGDDLKGGQLRFGTGRSLRGTNEYSDHLPIGMVVTESD